MNYNDYMTAPEASNIIRLIIEGRLSWMDKKTQLGLIKPVIDSIS